MTQEPRTAKYTGMPQSAIKTGLVDYLLPPEKMADELIRYVKRANHELAPRKPLTSFRRYLFFSDPTRAMTFLLTNRPLSGDVLKEG